MKLEIHRLKLSIQYMSMLFGPPPPDKVLPSTEDEINRIISERLKEHGISLDH